MDLTRRDFLSVGLVGALAFGSGCNVERESLRPEIRLLSGKMPLDYQPKTLPEIMTYNCDNVLYTKDSEVSGVLDYWTSPAVMMERAKVSGKIREDCDGITLFNCALAEFKQLDYFPAGFSSDEKSYPPTMLILLSGNDSANHAVALLKDKTIDVTKYGMIDNNNSGFYPIYDSVNEMIRGMNKKRLEVDPENGVWTSSVEADLSKQDYWKYHRKNLFPRLYNEALNRSGEKRVM